MFRKLKPIMFEESRLPVILSKFAPIEIGAITLFPFVFSRGKMSEETKRHETIHFQQQLELLFVGQWILYGAFWLIGLCVYRDGAKAYKENPFEREAYRNDDDSGYLATRRRYAWLFYLFK